MHYMLRRIRIIKEISDLKAIKTRVEKDSGGASLKKTATPPGIFRRCNVRYQ